MHLQEELIEAHLDHSEQPEMLLDVNEEEILVEKYISEEEQKRLDELARLEEGKSSIIFHVHTTTCFLFFLMLLFIKLTRSLF